MRSEKMKMFVELKEKRNSKEYEEWFLKYRPGDKTKLKIKTLGVKQVAKKTKKKTKSTKTAAATKNTKTATKNTKTAKRALK